MAPNNGVVNQPSTKLGTTSRHYLPDSSIKVRVIPRTVHASGYSHIYAATGQSNTAVQEKIQQTYAQALANLATTTTANRQALGTLSTTNATLTAELWAVTSPITKSQRQLTLYTDASLSAPATPTPCACVQIDSKGYCWYLGYHVSTAHNGCTCNNTLPVHQKDVTQNNPMGGSTKKKPEWNSAEDTKVEGKHYNYLVIKPNIFLTLLYFIVFCFWL